MKKGLLLFFVLLMGTIATYAAPKSVKASPQNQFIDSEKNAALVEGLQNMSLEEVLNMTPKSYREKTGERLGFVKSVKLKIAQTVVKRNQRKSATDLPKAAYIVLAFIGFGWLAMGLLDNFEGNNWWIGLILYALLWLPGFIYSLIKMKDYY